MALHWIDEHGRRYVFETHPRPRRVARPQDHVSKSTPPKKEIPMSTDKTTGSAEDSTVHTATGAADTTAQTDNTASSTVPPTQEQAAPGGKKGEAFKTFALRVTLRGTAKFLLAGAGYIALALAASALLEAAAALPIFLYMAVHLFAIYGMLVATFLGLIPLVDVTVDLVADRVKVGWSKVKSFFSSKVVIVEPVTDGDLGAAPAAA